MRVRPFWLRGLKVGLVGDRLKNVWLVSSDRPSVEMEKIRFFGRASKTLYREFKQGFSVFA